MPNLCGLRGFLLSLFAPGKQPVSTCPESLRLVDIDPRHQPVKLPPGQVPHLRLVPRPLISSRNGESLIDKDKPVRFMIKSFDPVTAPSTEKKQCAALGIELQLTFNDSAESIYRFAHVSMTANDVDLIKARDIA